MRNSAVLSLSHTSVDDGQRMYSLGRLEWWERIYPHCWHRNWGDQHVEAEYSLYWGWLLPELRGRVEAPDPPSHGAPHFPFPCKAVREHGEKTAMFCAHVCPVRGHLGGCSLFVQCLNHNRFAKWVSASSLNTELKFWVIFIKCTFLLLVFVSFI